MSNLNTEDKQNLTDNVCNELLQNGITPSVSLVLAKLPFTNTRSTAHKYFKKWVDDQSNKKEDMFKKLGFSSEFNSSVLNEITRFNADSEGRFKEQAQYANDQRDQAISDLEMSENKLNKQAEIVNQQEKQIIYLQTELATDQKSNESTIVEIRRQLTTSVDDNKQLSKQNESLRTDIARSELKLESNQQLLDEIKSQNSHLTSDNKQLNSNIAELNRSIASKESTITGNEKLIKTLENAQEKTGEQLISFDSNNAILQSDLASVRDELLKEKEELTQQTSKNTELRASFEEQKRAHEKTLRSYEATISSNEKLIIQLEKKVK